MQWTINCAPKFPGVDSVDVDFTSVCSDENVIFAWMDVEAGDFSLPNEVLEKLGLRHATISDINKLHSNAIWRSYRKHTQLSTHLLALNNSVAI